MSPAAPTVPLPPGTASDPEGPERVVMLDDDGAPIGTALKAEVHTEDTALHLAFSAHLRAPDGRVLLTRRALDKRTWPGVWTNSFCGHPAPGEPFAEAIRRRGAEELGLDPALLGEPEVVVPGFRYRAVDAGGLVEHEICPVHVVDYLGDPEDLPAPNPAEVMDAAWVRIEDTAEVARRMPLLLSPWFVEQLAEDGLLRGVADA